MKVFFFVGTDTTLQLSADKSIRLAKYGQRVELTDEQAEAHAAEAPLVPESEWPSDGGSPAIVKLQETK